jgi:uncharacterized membrane protein YczE
MNRKIVFKLIQLFLGFFLIALGVVFMRYSSLGLNPWGTFHDGVSKLTGIRFGTVTQLTGLSIVLLSMTMKIYPGVGTLLNMYFCGFFINMIDSLGYLPQPSHIMIKILYLFLGILILAIGIYTYISVGFGAGPRDGLMVGLVKKTKYSVGLIRNVIEVTALILGYLMGGTVGVGTIVTAIFIGYAIQAVFYLKKYNPKETDHLSILEFFTVNFK